MSALPMVSRRLLPPLPAEDLHAPDRPIATPGPRTAARKRCRASRRDHDPRLSPSSRLVERHGVVGRVSGHAREVTGDVPDKRAAGRRVVGRRGGERLRHDHPGAVDPKMQLLPAALPATAMFGGSPFTLAKRRHARTVDHKMQRTGPGAVVEGTIELLTAPRECRMVRHLKGGLQYGEDRPQEALRLTQRQAEHEAERQRGFDCRVRELPRSARTTRWRWSPRGQRGIGQPKRDIAPPRE